MFLFRNLRYLFGCIAALLCYLVLDRVGPLLKFIGFRMGKLHWYLAVRTNRFAKPFFQDPETEAEDAVLVCVMTVTFIDFIGSIFGFIFGAATLMIWPTDMFGIILLSVCGLSLIGWLFMFLSLSSNYKTFGPIE